LAKGPSNRTTPYRSARSRIKGPAAPPIIVIVPSAPAYPTNTDCWGFGRMVHCSTSKKAPPQEERAMHPVVSWLVVLGLFFAIWIVPAAWIGWIGSPREVLGWGVFIGGMTPVVLGVLDRIGRETKYENYTASKEKR
jgi:hypothetical protein